MSEQGINVDFMHAASPGFEPSTIAACGSQWVRFVLRPKTPLGTIIALKKAGVKTLGLFINESVPQESTMANMLSTYLKVFGPHLDALQCGNEPDGTGESSTVEPRGTYLRRISLARMYLDSLGLRDVELIPGGLISGDPSWITPIIPRLIRLGVTKLAVHPYGIRPLSDYPSSDWGFGRIDGIIERYFKPFRLPLWFTEWGASTDDFADEPSRAQYISEMIESFYAIPEVDVSMVYCLSQVMGPHGLLDAEGNALESWAAYCNSF